MLLHMIKWTITAPAAAALSIVSFVQSKNAFLKYQIRFDSVIVIG